MGLIGSILGDIAGSIYEYRKPAGFNYKTVELFTNDCFFTDDTVMSIATKIAVDQGLTFTEAYQELGRQYPNCGYGGAFYTWIKDDEPEPYGSFGNGSAMRAAYIGEYYNCEKDVIEAANKSAECTHNHSQGIKGAVVTAMCNYLCRTGASKAELYNYMKQQYSTDKYYYGIQRNLDEARHTYKYDVTCQGTVPVAARCFLESTDYESCIRNVFSLNGDTDTLACIAGGIAESYYGTTGFDNDKLLKKFLDKRLYELI